MYNQTTKNAKKHAFYSELDYYWNALGNGTSIVDMVAGIKHSMSFS